MIMSIVTAILARWQIALGVAALLVASHTLAYCDGRRDGREAAEAEHAALQAAALERARKADQAAADRVTKGQNDVEAANQRAREAGGDDRLGAAFDSLRREARSGATTR